MEPLPSQGEERILKFLHRWGSNIWIVEGPDVDFFSFPYPTRMVVVRLTLHDDKNENNDNDGDNIGTGGTVEESNRFISSSCCDKKGAGGAWLWSPIPWSSELQAEIEAICNGPIRFLVSPNYLHWLFLREWQEQCPDATVLASPSLAQRKAILSTPGLTFDATLDNDTPDPRYAFDLDQVILWSDILPEVVFFHKFSRTLIVCDYIQRFSESDPRLKGWKGWLMKADGMVGPNGTAPGELRLYSKTIDRASLPKLSKALNRIRSWQPEKLIIAHGENAPTNAMQAIESGFRWIPDNTSSNQPLCPCPCCLPSKIENPTQQLNTATID